MERSMAEVTYHLAGDFTDWSILRSAMDYAGCGRWQHLLVIRCDASPDASPDNDSSPDASPDANAMSAGTPSGGARSSPNSSRSRGAAAPRKEEFQVVCNRNWKRRIYPAADEDGYLPLGQKCSAAAEEGQGHGRNWMIRGSPGDTFRVILDTVAMTVTCELVRLGGGSGGQWRGVNLGGWLVLERWITPQLFEDVAPEAHDELAFMAQGGCVAKAALGDFRDRFLSQHDFAWLQAEGGLNAVRLPVGYWCLEEHAAGTPFLPTRVHVDAAFDWALKYGLKVLLELHGAAGSQNAEHHSGQSGAGINWLEGAHREMNLKVLEAWAVRWGSHPALLGFGFGNEVACPAKKPSDTPECFVKCRGAGPCRYRRVPPPPGYWDRVVAFYAEAARRVRPHLRRDAPLVIDTCWDMNRFNCGRLRNIPGPVWLDYHHYECFGSGDSKDVDERRQAANLYEQLTAQPRALSDGVPDFVLGEFSLALKPSTPGYARTDWQKLFFEQQTAIAASKGVGWFFWTYKMARKGWPHWSYRESVAKGWIVPEGWLCENPVVSNPDEALTDQSDNDG